MKVISLMPLFCIYSLLQSQENPWYSTGFVINDFTPRAFYWDTTAGWFYIGGNLTLVDSQQVNGMFRIDSMEHVDYMDTVGLNMDIPLSIIKYHDTIHYCGARGLYKIRDSTWVSIIKDHLFYELEVFNDVLFAGGYFKNAVSQHDGVAIRYDGTQFSPFEDIYDLLADTINFGGASIYEFEKYKGKLYMGGNFDASFNGKYNEVISWDGVNWDDMDGGIPGNSGLENVSALSVYKNELYVGGKFSNLTGSMSNNILKWDGQQWNAIGNGIYGQGVSELFVYRDELWVVGALDSVDNLSLSNVAIWDGSNWCSPGGIFQSFILSIGSFLDTLYVGGNFWHIDGDSTKKFIAKYNPAADRICGPPVGITKLKKPERNLHFYPNPNQGEVFIETTEFTGLLHIDVYNLNGEKVSAESKTSGNLLNLSIPGENGMYVVYLRDEFGNSASVKVLKDK